MSVEDTASTGTVGAGRGFADTRGGASGATSHKHADGGFSRPLSHTH